MDFFFWFLDGMFYYFTVDRSMEQLDSSKFQAKLSENIVLTTFLGICCRHKKDSLKVVAIAYPLLIPKRERGIQTEVFGVCLLRENDTERTDWHTLMRFHALSVWHRGIDGLVLCILERINIVSGERAKIEQLTQKRHMNKGPTPFSSTSFRYHKELKTFSNGHRNITGVYSLDFL